MNSLLDGLLFSLLLAVPLLFTLRLMRRMKSRAHEEAGKAALEHDNRFWTLVATAFRLRCPVCKQGRIFPSWFAICDRCPVCDVKLNRGDEGFFIGSVYFNYGATGAILVGGYLLSEFLLGWPTNYVIVGLVAFAVVFPLFFLRYARASLLVFDQYFAPRLPERRPPDETMAKQ